MVLIGFCGPVIMVFFLLLSGRTLICCKLWYEIWNTSITLTAKQNNMKKSIFGLLILSFLFSNFTCHKCESDLRGEEVLVWDILPLQTTYQVGDTLILRSSTDAIFEYDSGDLLDHSNLPLTYNVQPLRIQPNNNPTTAVMDNDFNTIGLNGSMAEDISGQFAVTKITTVCDNDSCNFELGIILQEEGIFSILLGNGEIYTSECEQFGFIGRFNVTDNNFSICQNINTTEIDLYGLGPQLNASDAEEMYFFEVTN